MNEASLTHCPPLNHYPEDQFWEFASVHPVGSSVSCWEGHRVHKGPWDVTSLGMGHTWTEFPWIFSARENRNHFKNVKQKKKPQGLEILVLGLSESRTGM